MKRYFFGCWEQERHVNVALYLCQFVNTTTVPLAPSSVTAIGPWHHMDHRRDLRVQKYNQQNVGQIFMTIGWCLQKHPEANFRFHFSKVGGKYFALPQEVSHKHTCKESAAPYKKKKAKWRGDQYSELTKPNPSKLQLHILGLFWALWFLYWFHTSVIWGLGDSYWNSWISCVTALEKFLGCLPLFPVQCYGVTDGFNNSA